VLIQQLTILRNISVIEIGNSKIKENIKKKGEIENDKIKPKILGTNHVLHSSVNAKNPEWLNQQIQKKKKTKVGKKLTLHAF